MGKLSSVSVGGVLFAFYLSACCSDSGETERINAAVSEGNIDMVLEIGKTSCSAAARLHVNKLMSEIMSNSEGAAKMGGEATAKILDFWRDKWNEKESYEGWDKRIGLTTFLTDFCFYGEPKSAKRGVMCQADWDSNKAFQEAWFKFAAPGDGASPASDGGLRRIISECVLCMDEPEFIMKADIVLKAHNNVEFPFVMAEKALAGEVAGELAHDFFAGLTDLPPEKLEQKVTVKGDPKYSDDEKNTHSIKQYIIWGLVKNFKKGITEKTLNGFIEKITDNEKARQDFEPKEWNNPVFFKSRKGFYSEKYRETIYEAAEVKPCSWLYFALAAYDGKFDKGAFKLAADALKECKSLPVKYYASVMRCRGDKDIPSNFLPPEDLSEITGGFGIKEFSCLDRKPVRKRYFQAVYDEKLEKERRKAALKSLEKLCEGRNARKDYCLKVKQLKLDYYFQY
ncbi:MAG: hypothetical protein Kow0090_05340 [Myxococcota bacterium]